ncbi:hypothetical protein F5888DRAFT_827731 [Russula emetica]|nr:hypothetical protein F5888DRAFT_827731 [Russula emetica]
MEMSEVASQSAQGPSTHDEVHEDLVNEMWTEYLKNVDDYDKRLTDGWKDDANGVLVFTGLFSAIVASFIIESYKLLSPDPGSQSVFLLGQLSQQFAGFANGTYVQPQSYPSSPPSASIICVNILWLLSFLLSTTSALFATLMLQWARIYIDLPQIPSVSKERARVRSVLFFGMKKYRMHLAVETAPTLLHLSVFLFFIGLVVFFFTIFKMVAVVILISVGVFGLAYFALTILPCLDHSCPYRTPMSSLWWYLWHTSLSYVARYLHFILRQLHNYLVPLNLGEITTRRQLILTQWLQTFEDFAEKHGERLKHGFRGTVVECARVASQDIDVEALTWLFQLPALTEKNKIQKRKGYFSTSPLHPLSQLYPRHSFRCTRREYASAPPLGMLECCPPHCQSVDCFAIFTPIERNAVTFCKYCSHATIMG